MKVIEKRLASLEQGKRDELVSFSFQWDNGPLVKRMAPKSHIGWLYEA
jgi:hypothetical protein